MSAANQNRFPVPAHYAMPVFAPAGSAMARYCEENGIEFVATKVVEFMGFKFVETDAAKVEEFKRRVIRRLEAERLDREERGRQ